MAESLMKLKRQAMELGMNQSKARTAERAQLERYIEKHSDGDASKPKKKAAVASAVKKKKASAESGTSAPAKKKSEKSGKAKRQTAAPRRKKKDDTVGRAQIGKVNYADYDEDDWKPRDGSPVERIFKSLKKHKDNVDKVFEDLKSDVWDFVGKTMRDGTKRDKASALEMLKYRINRTRFEFAVRTGQHEPATNRVPYGTGDYAKASKKAKRASKPAKAEKPKKTKKRGRGRPKGSKNKPKS
jgi:hypothetical protein